MAVCFQVLLQLIPQISHRSNIVKSSTTSPASVIGVVAVVESDGTAMFASDLRKHTKEKK
jgi:hypothetical protein